MSAHYDPTYLDASETAYNEAIDDAVITLRQGGDIETMTNPYTRLRDDRRKYVLDTIADAYGPLVDDEGELYDDDYVDALLDAHADWIASHDATKAGAWTRPELGQRYVIAGENDQPTGGDGK